MAVEFKLPELGENIEEAEVAELLVQEGDEISAEQSVMELETEKAVVELPCPHAGRISKVHVSAGDTIKVGDVVLTVEEDGEAPSEEEAEGKEEAVEPKEDETAKEDEAEADKAEKKPEKEETEEAEAEKPAKKEETEEKAPAAREKKEQPSAKAEETEREKPPPPAGPATRLLARKLGVDLEQVTGTGSNGRITQEDVEQFVHDRMTGERPSSDGAPAAAPKLPDFSKFGEVERQKLSKLNRTAVDQLSRSWDVIPHVTQHELTDVTDLEAARKQFLEAADDGTPKITMTAIAVKACAQMLKEFPRFNASFDAETSELVLKKYVHIGVAVDTEAGLVVPVIRDADEKTLRDVAGEMIDLADKARERKLSMEQMQGASFTITNLGGIGGTSFTPIVSWPEVAILGMSRYQKQPALTNGQWQERLMLPLSLSYDHRVINGADAARFIVRLAKILQSAFALLADS